MLVELRQTRLSVVVEDHNSVDHVGVADFWFNRRNWSVYESKQN